ncbi:MAG: sulfatase [Acidobacteriota bacterium]|nr:sulfatase-like hydrolase/transferase [Acidobacteriota bacterium]
MTRLVAFRAALVVALATAGCTGFGPGSGRPGGTPVILVSWDTTRADRLNCYGYPDRRVTPNLDALADDGILFENHISAAPWTPPAHASLLTSLWPSTHGVIGSFWEFRDDGHRPQAFNRLAESRTTLAEVLQAGGYATGAFTGGLTIDPHFGFDQGFETFRTTMFKLTDENVGEMRDWIGERQHRPFFLFWHTFEAHAPYLGTAFLSEVLPEREAERLREAVGRYAARFERKAVGPAWFPKMLKRRRAYTRDVTEALYVGSIADADRWLGILVEDLRGRGLYDRALIVVTSDHGEEFGDRSPEIFYDAHGASLHREMVRVPLVVKLPGQDRGGTRVEALTRGVDVMPTVLDVLSLPGPAEMQGESLRPLWEGREATPRVAYAEALQDRHEQKAIQSSGYKLIVQIDAGTVARQGRAHVPAVLESRWLFDLSSDPNERQDLLAAPRRSGDERRADALEVALRGHVAAQETDTDEVEVHDELLQQLRSLGYVE